MWSFPVRDPSRDRREENADCADDPEQTGDFSAKVVSGDPGAATRRGTRPRLLDWEIAGH
jgi:hypothetical protein